MRKLLLSLLAIFLLVTGELAAQEKFNVGAILPLTGEFAPVGQDLRDGMELALSESDDKSMVIHFEDDKSFNRVAAVKAANKLLNLNKVKIMLNGVVNTMDPLAPLLTRKKVPGIVVWDSNRKISSFGEYVYGMGYSTELAGEDMASFAINNLKTKKVALISAHDEWSEIISSAFKEKYQNIGGNIVLHERVHITESDFRSMLARIKNSGADAIYCPVYDMSLTSLLTQARQLNFKGKILTGDGLTPHIVSQLGKSAEGVYVTQVDFNNPQLEEKYRAHFGPNKTPDNIGFVALGYDAVKMILSVIKTSTQPEELNDLIANYKSSGFSGEIQFTENHLSSKQEKIYVVNEQQFEVAETAS